MRSGVVRNQIDMELTRVRHREIFQFSAAEEMPQHRFTH